MLNPSGFITVVRAFWQRRVSFIRSVSSSSVSPFKSARLSVRHDHKMATSIGIGVEQSKAGSVARDDVIGLVIVGLGDPREQARSRLRLGCQDIFDPPRSVQ